MSSLPAVTGEANRRARSGLDVRETNIWTRPNLALVLGTLLLVMGVVIPPSAVVESLTATPGDRLDQLLLGAVLFKLCVGVLGLLIIVLPRLPLWESALTGERPPRLRAHRARGSSDLLDVAILVAIVLVASALRLYRLDAGLWHDEILTYLDQLRVPFGESMTAYDSASKNQHFLFTALAHLAFLLFGDSTWSLRLPAVLFGLASIGALYLFAREVGDRWEALLAAGLLACSYHHVWFSQSARGYTGLMFWTILSSWCLVRVFDGARPRVWLIYAAAVALGMYTHLLIYLGVLAARRTRVWPGRWTGLFLGFGLGGFLTLMLYSLVLPQMLFGPAIHEVSRVAAWKNPFTSVLELLQGTPNVFVGAAAIGGLVVLGAGLASFARTKPVVVCLFLLPVLLTAAVGIAMGHHLWPRYFFFAGGFGALVVLRGVLVLGRRAAELARIPGRSSMLLRLAPGVALVLVSALSVPPVYGPKQDYQGALAFVEERREPGDAIVMVGLAAMSFQRLYGVDWEVVEDLEAFNAVRARARRTWVIYTLPVEVQALHPDILASVQREFGLARRFDGTLGGGAMYVYRSDIAPASLPSAGPPVRPSLGLRPVSEV
jgi:mannosyltransferase